MRTVKLRKPVSLGEQGQLVTELHLREEVVAGDMRGIVLRPSGEMTWDEHIKLVSRLSGQPEPLIAKLSIADLGEAIEIAMGFSASGQATGTTPSPSSPPPSTSASPSSGS